MIEIQQENRDGLTWLILKGRIDSMTSSEIQQEIDDLTATGERLIILDFSAIVYISSAGLRVLLLHQKKLKKVDGELILYNLIPEVFNVFKTSHLNTLFRIFDGEAELLATLSARKTGQVISTRDADGIALEYIQSDAPAGKLFTIGSQEKMNSSAYNAGDVVPISAGEIQYGTGLATTGVSYDSMKELFGEAIVLNHSLFYYPAIKNACVDFMLHTPENSAMMYQFFHGFGFQGKFNMVLKFQGVERFADLNALMRLIPELLPAQRLGIVLLAESKGLFGMSLKQVPIVENRPEDAANIFSKEHFPDWIDFPVEPTFIDHVVLGTGIWIRDREKETPEIAQLVPKETGFHLHAAIFDKEPLVKNIAHFEKEMQRITNESGIHKVQHLLGQSRFSSGMIGTIAL